MKRPLVQAGRSMPPPAASSPRVLGWLMGAAAALAVLLTLGGPGLTIDEPLDVRPGRDYVKAIRARGWDFFSRATVDRVFRDNAEHPPLGRWLLGLASTLGEPFQVWWDGPDPTGLHVLAGRAAPALCFGLLIGVITAEAARRRGRAAGLAAGWALLVMPRVFSHAHFGALDTFLSLFWTAALVAAARAFEPPFSHRRVLLAGALWALALLTKIHAWLLWPLVAAWACRRLPPRQAIRGLAIWTGAGVALFLAGWPWLWYDTVPRWAAYWGTSVHRATIMVEYFGRILPDRDVPWHYPWFYFTVTVPIGLQLLGGIGLVRGLRGLREDPFPGLLGATIGLFLVLFSTRIPVYDGERLFLHVFPAWAILIGFGFAWLWERWKARALVRRLLLAAVLAQCWGTVTFYPFGLSYYNLLTGGLSGAERLGLELTYWGDAVDRALLDRLAAEVAPGQAAALAPTLYPGQGILTTTARLARKEVVLGDESAAGQAEWLIVSRRRAYWSPELVARIGRRDAVRVATRSRQGVWLSALWHFPGESSGTPRRADPGGPADPRRDGGRAATIRGRGGHSGNSESPSSRNADNS
ncbi:MAG: glycosyltransferase family 39 protein [Isosphaeraceae bacterium]